LDQKLQFSYPSIKGAQATALKREHPALKKIKFVNCFLFFWVFFTLLDPDLTGSGSGSTALLYSVGVEKGALHLL
jgi:hypothetical protein